MIIGVPKEIKANENRVAITPSGVLSMVQNGHTVYVEAGAGLGSMITDEEYIKAGAKTLKTAAEVWKIAEMIIKVKEPLASEYQYFHKDLLLFTYLHLAAEEALTKALLDSGVTGIAYETVQPANGSLPLLAPMSEVAGRMSVIVGANILAKHCGGCGMLLGGVPGVPAAKVAIIGGGIVGTNAAKMALGLGAQVTMLDNNIDRLRQIDDIFSMQVTTMASNSLNIAAATAECDLLVGAVLIPGAKAPKLVSEEMVKNMKKGAAIVDVAIDQGGSIATIDRITTHMDPTYITHDVVHYSVANMPGAMPRTSTFALTNVTMPYAVALANKGWKKACKEDIALERGLNTSGGKCTYKAVSEAFNLAYVDAKTLIG